MKVERIFAGPMSFLSGLPYKIAIHRSRAYKEMFYWCKNTFKKNTWTIMGASVGVEYPQTFIVYFQNKDDATVFILRWA